MEDTVQQSRRRPRVLYVEDDDRTAETYGSGLRDHYELVRLESGTSAINWLDQADDDDLPNLVLLDYQLPDMTGIEVLSYIRNDSRYDHVMAIMLSNHNDVSTSEVAFRLGALGWLLRSALSPQQVAHRLRDALLKRGQVG